MFAARPLRLIARILLVTFTSLTLQPVQAALRSSPAVQRPSAQPDSAEAHYSRTLAALEDVVRELAPEAARPAGAAAQAARPLLDTVHKVQKLRELTSRLRTLEDEAEAGFAQVEAELKARHLPAAILARHRQAVQTYRQRQAEFTRHLDAVERAGGQPGPALDGLARFLAQHPSHKQATPTDPRHLPFRSPEAKVRAPKETAAELKAILHPEPFQNPLPPGEGRVRGKAKRPKVTQAAPSPGAPAAQSAAANTTAPTREDLAETEDVQLTPAIQAQAAVLHHNPVEIHHWVRNHIEFLPSYGSIQGSDLTLQTRRGNAFDTASLEIALLRASNIPARYAYGTVQIPADQVMNWVGGVSTPEAAQSLLGQGGIPNVGLVSGGKIAAFKLEHVWVDAYVDFVPSRGAKHQEGDTWVPLDASFKQYQYAQGMDIQIAVPFDVQDFLAKIQQGATVNETEGWVQNLDQGKLQQALTDYQAQVKTYIDQHNPNATVGDVLGTQKIVIEDSSVLAGGLPYKTLASGGQSAALADGLRWRYRTALYGDANAYALGDSPLATLSQSTARLAGQKITVSYRPSSQADIDLLNSYLPKPHEDGTPIQPSELPTSLPVYLLHVTPEIRVGGELVNATPASVTLGSELWQATAFYNPSSGQWEEGEANRPIAGEYHALGLDLQGLAASQLTAHKAKLEATNAKLQQFQQNPNDPTPIQNLTKEDLTGDLLYSGILGYFASVDSADSLAARTGQQVINYRLPSYGDFFAAAQPHYWFGLVRSVSFPGVVMDVDRITYQVEAKDYDPKKKLTYMRQVGSAGSAFEHAVPERLFVDIATCNAPDIPNPDPNKPPCPQGVSAVKALAIAAKQGQKIYTLNAENQAYHATILAQLALDADTKREIQDALATGKEVTTHQAEITVNGWSGAGYIILDKDTGAGAYKIAGGANGAWLVGFASGAMLGLFLAGLATVALTGPMVIAALGILLVYMLTMLTPFIALMLALYHDNKSNDEWRACFWGGFGIGLSVASKTMPGGILADLVFWIGVSLGIGVPSNAATQCFN